MRPRRRVPTFCPPGCSATSSAYPACQYRSNTWTTGWTRRAHGSVAHSASSRASSTLGPRCCHRPPSRSAAASVFMMLISESAGSAQQESHQIHIRATIWWRALAPATPASNASNDTTHPDTLVSTARPRPRPPGAPTHPAEPALLREPLWETPRRADGLPSGRRRSQAGSSIGASMRSRLALTYLGGAWRAEGGGGDMRFRVRWRWVAWRWGAWRRRRGRERERR